jgi:hypothetical protein
LNKPIDARICYETLKDRLDSNQELSYRLQLVFIEEYPAELLKM